MNVLDDTWQVTPSVFRHLIHTKVNESFEVFSTKLSSIRVIAKNIGLQNSKT